MRRVPYGHREWETNTHEAYLLGVIGLSLGSGHNGSTAVTAIHPRLKSANPGWRWGLHSSRKPRRLYAKIRISYSTKQCGRLAIQHTVSRPRRSAQRQAGRAGYRGGASSQRGLWAVARAYSEHAASRAGS